MSIEMKTNLAAAIQEKYDVFANKQNYTSLQTTYGNVQNSTYTFNVWELLQHGWSYNIHWKQHREGVHLRGDSITSAAIRKTIAEKLQLPIDAISPNLQLNARGNGAPFLEIVDGQFAWETYSVVYKHRKLEEKMLFDQEKYEAALDLCDQNIASIKESIEVAGNVGEVDFNIHD